MNTDLREYLKPFKTGRFGFSDDDARHLQWSDDLADLVSQALECSDRHDFRLALMVVEGCSMNGTLRGGEKVKLVDFCWDITKKNQAHELSEVLRAIRMIDVGSVNQWMQVFTSFFQSDNPLVRLEAIRFCDGDLLDKHVNILKSFIDDTYHGEVSMNGRHEYLIRNEVFHMLSERFNNTKKLERVDVVDDGERVYYWDWKPLLRKMP